MTKLTAVITSQTINATLFPTTVLVKLGFNRVYTAPNPYTGKYKVEPCFEAQILETKEKTMLDDVEVSAIEVQRVSNVAGGRTVFIGGTLNG